ncbi:hypothetical protein F889_00702 [Acinetobacter colistiniresistens]|uniref:Uncharacterized protein n=1 Tax=Acinetobacter colistiniresistens TaxID=280145 RepID=N9PRC7_9GAMM|nr:hypothetical protein F889_00702 [Acinetobacter colistiniresistens]
MFSGCTRDPIKEVLNNADGIPQQEKDRTVNWYKTKPELSKEIRSTCDIDTTKYFQRDDCINAKAAMNLILIESYTDPTAIPQGTSVIKQWGLKGLNAVKNMAQSILILVVVSS